MDDVITTLDQVKIRTIELPSINGDKLETLVPGTVPGSYY